MKKKYKVIFNAMILVTVLLLLSNFHLYEKINKTPAALSGTFQSEESYPRGAVMISFTHDGEFEEYYNSKLIDTGTYKKENQNVYTLHSEEKNDLLVLEAREEDQFYYYTTDKQVYLLKKVSSVPTKITTKED